MDGGAVGASGTIEKNINLSIAKKLYYMCGLFGVPCKMTRTDDISLDCSDSKTTRQNKTADLKARAKIASETHNAVFLSIHLNKFSQSASKGAQTFYSPNHEAGKLLAESIQQSLVRNIAPDNHRLAKQGDSSIYLLKTLECPAVIVECGFLSNPQEEASLLDDNYQKKIALAIFAGYTDFLVAK